MSIRRRWYGGFAVMAVLGVLAGCGSPDTGAAATKSREAGQFHPADTNNDGQLSLQEAVAYATAFKRQTAWPTPPTPVPLNYAVNACSLFVRGTTYHYDATATPPFATGPDTSSGTGGVTVTIN